MIGDEPPEAERKVDKGRERAWEGKWKTVLHVMNSSAHTSLEIILEYLVVKGKRLPIE